ncbi:MAG: sulfatase-like hydrolase/transferase [Bacteroidia bacterium]|nr:sulfatase-like hydrolase/transferase [Bacteroidia bacterium]
MLNRVVQKIPSYIQFLFKLYALNLGLFFFIRLFFYFVNKASDVGNVVFFEKLMAFRMGLEFDTAVFCWIAFLPVLIFSISHFFKHKFKKLYAFGFYSFLVLELIYFFVCIANIPYFAQFGTHLNKNALLWNEDPDFIVGMIFGNFSYWGYLLLYVFIAFVFVKVAQRFYKTFKFQIQHNKKTKLVHSLISFIVFAGLVTIGARGRTSDRSGLHEGLSIVSQNGFINQVAINPNFTFWKTLVYNEDKKPYEIPKSINEQLAFTRNYLGIKTAFAPNIDRIIKDTLHKKYSFVIVVMESMSVFKMGYYNGKKLTPHLDKLIKESVFFDNFFSSGIHTFNGLFSTTTGFPGILSEKSMKSYVKNPFNGVGPLLSAQGYETYFYTTHDPHFDNMEGFFKINKFQHFISQYDFDFSQAESSLGVPDHVLFDKLIEVTNSRKNDDPFLAVMMTASDHGPWKVPENIPFKPTTDNEQDRCTQYADWSIGRFMSHVKKMPWYNNTVFMFLGDHGLSLGHTYEMPLAYNHVPFVIHHPNSLKADTISSPAYQPDVPATVMGIIGATYTNSTFGINILKEKHPFVVFSADDKIGCVDNNGFYYYKTLANDQRYLRKYKNLDPVNYVEQLRSKSDSMEKEMMMIYESANYFIRKDHFLYE